MPGRRIAFVSAYSLIDQTSGAAIATARGLQLLAEAGFECQAFCACMLDAREEVCFEQTLAELRLPYELRTTTGPGGPVRLVFTELRHTACAAYNRPASVPVTVFRNRFTQVGPTPQEVPAFLAACEQFLQASRPDVLLTYGGGPLGDAVIRRANARGIPVVFWVHNFAYLDARLFAGVQSVIVPSTFSKEFYCQRVGVECCVLPNVVAEGMIGDWRSGARASSFPRSAWERE
jgi:hypothetical protein